jgi:hypothetical protein
LRRSAVPISPPAYKPPTMVPYFDQPIASPNPKFGSILLRWILILGVSLSLGAALAVAIWLFRHTAH